MSIDEPSNLLFTDLETTGPNPFLHQPLSIALVTQDERVPPCVVHIRVAEAIWSDYGRRNFASFQDEWTAAAVDPAECAVRIEDYILRALDGRPAILVGHNVGFDLAFIRKIAFLVGKEMLQGISHRSVDTHSLLHVAWRQGKIPASALNSDGAFEYFGIEIPTVRRHTALGDALAVRRLYGCLMHLFEMDGVRSLNRFLASG